MDEVIYSIYINYYNKDGNLVTTETKLYDIPMDVSEPNALIDPKVKAEMGKAGTFEFSIYANHPYYDCWNQMKTMMRVEYFGNTIFYGRVLTIDVDHITSKKSIHCEGYLAFLIDSIIEGLPDEKRPEINVNAYLNQLIGNHNSKLAGSIPPKSITKGMVPGHTPSSRPQIKVDASKKYGSSGWQDTGTAFGDLTKQYGGFLRIRYENGIAYLDWLEGYFNDTVDDRIVEITNNAISMSSTEEVNNIFTYVLPIGKNNSNNGPDSTVYLNPKYIRVPDIVNKYTDAQLNQGYHKKEDYVNAINKYGIIYKTISFPNADNATDLESWAWDWIKNNYYGGIGTFEVNAVDLKILGEQNVPLLVGDRCRVKYPTGIGKPFEERVLTITKAEYDLHKPNSNSYTIGIPNAENLNKTYGEKASKKSGGGKKSDSGSPGGGPPDNGDNHDDKVDHVFEEILVSQSEFNPEYQAYKEKYGVDKAATILRGSAILLNYGIDDEGTPDANRKARREVYSLFLDGKNGTMKGFKPIEGLENAIKNGLGPLNPKLNEILSDQYATRASMVVDAINGTLSLQEQDQLAYDAIKDTTTSHILRRYPLKTTFKIQTSEKTEADGSKQQYGEVAIGFTKRRGFLADPESLGDQIKMGMDGKISAMTAQFPSSVEEIADLYSGTNILGTLNLFGPQAKFSTTNTTDHTKETTTVEGNGSGGEGRIKVGQSGSKFRIDLNKPVTYKDKDGNTHKNVTGFVSAEDFQLQDSYDSLRVRLLVIDDLIADRATIGSLTAVEAKIDSLNAKVITTSNLSASIANLSVTSCKAIDCDGSVTTNSLKVEGQNLTVNGKVMQIANITKNGNTITVTKVGGSTITFDVS